MKMFTTFVVALIINFNLQAQNLADTAATSFLPATHSVEIVDITPNCAQFVKSIEACVPKLSCRIKFSIDNAENAYTYATSEKTPNGICKVIFSNKEPGSTFVSIFEFNAEQLKSAKKIVETYAQSKGKFELTNVDNCCNKDENAKTISYCKISMRGQTVDNVFASSSHYTCKGKLIKPIVEKEFRYSD